jgi:hypothetical protein
MHAKANEVRREVLDVPKHAEKVALVNLLPLVIMSSRAHMPARPCLLIVFQQHQRWLSYLDQKFGRLAELKLQT